MITIVHGSDAARRSLLRRRALGETRVPPQVQDRLDALFGKGTTPAEAVERVLADVRRDGDVALRRYTESIDGPSLADPAVPAAEIEAAYQSLPADLRRALETAAGRLLAFHEREPQGSWLHWEGGGALGQMVRPMQRVGLYVPGGTAAYPSSVLHAAVPAQVAGVEEIIVATPPDRRGQVAPVILGACHVAGISHVYRMGGVQAIAAMACGTATVPRVDKILGPGNIFVALAKRAVAGTVGIDQIAGPTETVLVADDSADAGLVAADMLAQAEHDPLASAILLTDSESLAREVQREIEAQLASLSRAEVARQSLTAQGGIAVLESLAAAVQLANEYAPEHLCLLVRDAWTWVGRVRNAGGVFVGQHAGEALGDYAVGPSHIMPTGGTARFSSPLRVADFLKVTSIFAPGEAQVAQVTPAAITLALAEGFTAHAAAMRRRTPGGGAT